METTLHYIHDPLCGWCYAAEPMLDAVMQRGAGRLRVELHGGGLFPGISLPASRREYIKAADARIGSLSGQVFGKAYLEGLLDDPATIYDSVPPIVAILAAQKAKPDSGPAMLKAIQRAHYRDGRRVVDVPVLAGIAESIGLERHAFLSLYHEAREQEAEGHLSRTRDLMRRVAAEGFPTFVLQTRDGFQRLRHDMHYAYPEEFAERVIAEIA